MGTYVFSYFFETFFKVYLLERETDRERKHDKERGRERGRQRESKQAPHCQGLKLTNPEIKTRAETKSQTLNRQPPRRPETFIF